MEVIPRTARILKIFEPNKFPNEIAFSLFRAAIIEVANSGILVPKETIVTAITRSLTPNSCAKEVAPKTNNSEPTQRLKPPIIKKSTILNTGKESFSSVNS